MLLDAIGSSEGSMGNSISMKGLPPSTARFTQNPTTKVFMDDGSQVTPGSRKSAWSRVVWFPLILHDEEKSARTFRTIDVCATRSRRHGHGGC